LPHELLGRRSTTLSKTQRKRLQQEDALSKNNGHDVRYRKRLMDEQEAYEELKRSLKELENKEESVLLIVVKLA